MDIASRERFAEQVPVLLEDAVDVATGTWTIVADSVRAFYRYASSSAEYTLSGKYTAGATVMTGTIGLGTSTTGVGLFSVTKQ